MAELNDFMTRIDLSVLNDYVAANGKSTLGLYRTPSTFCLNLDVEWRINERWAVYAEGRNLAGSTVYDWAYYYYDTAQGLLGVKFTF